MCMRVFYLFYFSVRLCMRACVTLVSMCTGMHTCVCVCGGGGGGGEHASSDMVCVCVRGGGGGGAC